MVRKHKGIHQSGKNKGRLKKGFKFTGRKTKLGLPIIKSVKNAKKYMRGGWPFSKTTHCKIGRTGSSHGMGNVMTCSQCKQIKKGKHQDCIQVSEEIEDRLKVSYDNIAKQQYKPVKDRSKLEKGQRLVDTHGYVGKYAF